MPRRQVQLFVIDRHAKLPTGPCDNCGKETYTYVTDRATYFYHAHNKSRICTTVGGPKARVDGQSTTVF